MIKVTVFFCILLYIIVAVPALYTDIYRILDAAPCVLLLNKGGPVGCTAPEGGVVGDLHVITNADELESFYSNSKNGDSKAVALPANLFNKEVTSRLHSTQKVKGVLVLYGPPATNGWSPDDVNPNLEWGLNQDASFEWNPPGDGLNFDKLPFPIYALSENESLNILALATNDTSYPRHAVQFNTFMHATKDAKTCLRRNQCMPLGGKSVWSSFNPVGSKPIIMAMANIDSTALFHDLATGADSTSSGIVGLIGAALALQNVNKSSFVNDIVFAFWAGESWGYLGSKKFLNDIQHFQCEKYDSSTNTCNKPYKPDLSFQNITLQNIISAIEFNQIGLTSSIAPALFIHQETTGPNSVSSLLQSVSTGTPLEFKPVNNVEQPGIPPSSMMSFLAAKPNLPGVVVTDHEIQYTNKNFHSHTDTGEFNVLSNTTLCHAATVLARTLYLLGTGQTQPDSISPTIEAPCSLLSDLAYCLSSNFNCRLLDNFLPLQRQTVPSYYTGVFGYSIENAYASAPAVLVYNMMALITANNVKYNFTSLNFTSPVSDGCSKCSPTEACINDVCVSAETHFHDAISLGIDWDYSNENWIIVNDSEPLWVESNWDSLGVELFRRANPATEGVFLAAGIIEFIVSLVAVYYAKRYFMRNYKIF
eukprot:Phypoly_transcript_04801.p1 GENE.Phypoly_transcript_04801~~Phypoly_transcript_04801.p1  ORF type:complete len:648 (+),score=53.03 Phypoly_transcript_04801:66-2009(+)